MINGADCHTSDSQRYRRNNQYGVITAGCLPTSDHEQVARGQRRGEVLRSDVCGSSGSPRRGDGSRTFCRRFRHHYREAGPHGCNGGPDRRRRHRYPTQRGGHDHRPVDRGHRPRPHSLADINTFIQIPSQEERIGFSLGVKMTERGRETQGTIRDKNASGTAHKSHCQQKQSPTRELNLIIPATPANSF